MNSGHGEAAVTEDPARGTALAELAEWIEPTKEQAEATAEPVVIEEPTKADGPTKADEPADADEPAEPEESAEQPEPAEVDTTTDSATEPVDTDDATTEPAQQAAPAEEVTEKTRPRGRRIRMTRVPSSVEPEAEPTRSRERVTRAAKADSDSGRDRTGVLLAVLAAVGLIAAGLAVWFAIALFQVRGSAAASNQALVDIGATAQVKGQVEDALKKVYSYDFARLDDNERIARSVITGDFTKDYEELFKQVRAKAPEQQAVVSATVPLSAVRVIDGDRAIVVVYLDQQITRVVGTQTLPAVARLTVTAQLVDGQWKIADVESR